MKWIKPTELMKRIKIRKKVFYQIGIVFFAGLFALSAFEIGKTLYGYRQIDETYTELQEEFVTTAVTPAQSETAGSSEQQESVQTIDRCPIQVDFTKLLETNPDVIGWLYCPGTVINYPVVQGDDNDYYLHRSLKKKKLAGGTLFADCHCSAELGGCRNLLIYGHNMKNGSMFGVLEHYKKQSFYNKHPVLYYLTPEHNYKIEAFAGYVTKDNASVYGVDSMTEKQFLSFLQQAKKLSSFRSDTICTADDRLITLSTCSYVFENARYVLIGKVSEID